MQGASALVMERDLEESFANLSVQESPVRQSPKRKNLVLSKFYALSTHDEAQSRIAVMLAPDSYKHEYRRDWEPKASKSTIVERPERLNACALGIGAAASKIPLHLVECTTTSDLRKSSATIKVHGLPWIDKLYELCSKVGEAHKEHKVEVPEDWPYNDMYLATETKDALESVVGTIENALQMIFESSIRRLFCCIRPPGHHCHEAAASGFCVVNNAHIAIQQAAEKHGVTHAAVFDFDLHHGDGTQDLCWKQDLPIGYFSIHDIHSFPTEKGYADPLDIMKASTCLKGHDKHIWNVHLEKYGSLEEFDEIYTRKYAQLFIQAMEFFKTHAGPDKKALIVISAGFDGSEYEMKTMQRHEVSVPTSFYNRFTRDCVALAETYCEGRVLSLLEGGYSNQALATGTFSHLIGLGGVDWIPEWVTPETADIFDKGTRKNYKPGLQWPGDAIHMGRQLFELRPKVVHSVSPVRRTRRHKPLTELTEPI